MPSLGLASRSISVVTHQVYVRRRADYSGGLPVNGEQDGWKLDDNLRCNQVRYVTGPAVGSASFDYIPTTAAEMRVETALARYSIDDQVRVVAQPVEDELVQQGPPGDPGDGTILFEGVLARPSWAIQTNNQGATEFVQFTAFPLAALDNQLADHLILGRWMYDRLTPTEANSNRPMIAWSPDMPAAFNFDGRPNMGREVIVAGLGLEGVDPINQPVFTHDDDPAGRYWTVRAAIGSILITWLYGIEARLEGGDNIAVGGWTVYRHICIASDLWDELGQFPDWPVKSTYPQLAGLDRLLPEVDVTGMHVLDALQAVCEAGGFEFAIEPNLDGIGSAGQLDRQWVLKVWAKGRGAAKTLRLAPANTTYTSVEQMFAANNVREIRGQLDGDAIVNEVLAVGEQFIEGRFDLKPGWAAADVSSDAVTVALRSVTPAKLSGAGYHARHLPGGALFAQYGHVGRHWIADCVGDPFLLDGTNFPGYTSGDYKHADEGFDFVDALALNDSTNALTTARSDAGMSPTIRWSNAVRRLLPLKSVNSQAQARDWYLEVSEDGGSTWHRLDSVRVSTLREYFGIKLNWANLATVNLDSLKKGNDQCTNVADSWWSLITQELLQFRVTCCIRTDHGAVHYAKRQSTSGSAYQRAQLIMPRGAEELWQQPGTLINDTANWRRAMPWGGAGGLAAAEHEKLRFLLRDAAVARRTALEDARHSIAASLHLFSFGEYRLGDVITKLEGREISFGTNMGTAARYPNIVGITYILSPGDAQGIRLELADRAFTGGYR